MKKIALFIMILVAAISCKKKATEQNTANNPVSSIPVNITVYPNDPFYFNIQAIGGWMYISGGLNGIVLYRKSEQEFVAVERTSSYLPNDPKARVKVMSDNFTLRDSVSDSRWRIFDGSITKDPATWPLRLYGTTYDGTTLKIKN